MPTIAISGYYGLGNLGDEAILSGIVAGFRAADPGIRLIALSADPSATQSLHGIAAVHRYSPPAVWRTLRASDLLLSGGGGLLQDTTSLRSPLYYLAVVRMAALAGVPAMIFAQGIGPLRRPVVRRLARRVLEGAAAATVRDAPSAEALRALGVSCPPIHVTADASLLMAPPSPEAAREVWRRQGMDPPPRPRVGVCLRPWPHRSAEAWVARVRQALEAACRSIGASLIFVPMQQPDDSSLLRRIAGGVAAPAVSLAQPGAPGEAMALMADMDVVVAMRLHALIFACAMGVPCVGLTYDPKVTAFLDAVGQPRLDLESDPQAAAEAIEAAFHSRAQTAPRLREAVERLRQAAARNVELALALLARCAR